MPIQRIKDTYSRYERYAPAAFFLGGLVFDIATTGRIDSWANIATQAVYLLVIGILLTLEALDAHGKTRIPRFLEAPWRYREEIIHFFLGSLLSVFTIFYFKSASLLSSFLFFVAIVVLLVANELPRFQKMGLSVRFAIFTVCLVSFFCYVIPILWGAVGFFPFLAALILSASIFYCIHAVLAKRVEDATSLATKVIRPAQTVIVVFFALYALQWIPPIPVSLTKIGIYHHVARTAEGYELSHEQPWWKFWRSGDQRFVARPGDKIYAYFGVFSPTGFADQVRVRWLFDGREGWSGTDAIPVKITGGREDGFRGFTVKENYEAGDWQVRVETGDGREIGRLYFTVEKATDSTTPREFLKTVH